MSSNQRERRIMRLSSQGEERSRTKQSKRFEMIYQWGFSYLGRAFLSTFFVDPSFIPIIFLLCIYLHGILGFVWMLGCRMKEVICLFALVLDCFYRCCWFLPLEFFSFGLGLKSSTFFIYCALHENYGCILFARICSHSLHQPKPME